jgi:hypothetical protein
MARRPAFTEGIGILGTVGNKETYSVDMFLAGFLTKNDRPQNARLRDCAANRLNYPRFSAWRCLAYFQRDTLFLVKKPSESFISFYSERVDIDLYGFIRFW